MNARRPINSLRPMKTLRAKLTALLVGAILLVVMLATGLSFFLLSPPHFEVADDATAMQVIVALDLIAQRPGVEPVAVDAPAGIRGEPPEGRVAAAPTAGINAALARRGRTERVTFTFPTQSRWPVISVPLKDGRWLVLPVAAVPQPEEKGLAVAGWALIIALGTTGVMLIAVRRLTEPLALLERTVAAIGPDGELSPLPDEGPTEVRATARAVNLLSSRLKSAMESRMRLVAAAGHDLRTPMTRMRLRAEFLDGEDRDTWIADLDELDRIADSAIRLVREEVDMTSREPVRLDSLVGEIVAEAIETQMKVSIDGSEPVTVMARPLALKRAIRNLVTNAATHGREARVHIGAQGGRAVVRIEDRGPGIPEDLLARVFEPFFRVEPARGAPIPGAGLGLAIAHEIIARHGGTLELRNLPGGGLRQQVEFEAVAGEELDRA